MDAKKLMEEINKRTKYHEVENKTIKLSVLNHLIFKIFEEIKNENQDS